MTLFVDPLQKPPAYIYALTVLVMLAFSLPGGLANHIRGGWLNLGQGSPALDENVLTHDGMLRFIMAFPSALLVGGMTLRLRRAFGLGFAYCVVTYFSLFIGWGCYMGIGSNPNDFESRVGAFDWLWGHAEEGWDYGRRWTRDVVAMSFRGLAWTSPTGLMLLIYGYGWLPLMSGLLMGPVYWMGGGIHETNLKGFGAGIPNSEALWGWWVWLVLIAVMTNYYRPRATRRTTRQLMRTPMAFTPAMMVALHTVLAIIEIIMLLSCVSYGMVEQKDMRNRNQSLIGLAVVTATLLMGHTVVLLRQCCVPSRRGSGAMYEYRSLFAGRRSSITDSEDGGDYGGGGDDSNPYAYHRDPSGGLGAGYGSVVSPFEGSASPGQGRVTSFGAVRLFNQAAEGAPDVSESAEKWLHRVNAYLCVPPEDPDAGADGVVALSNSVTPSPSGAVVLFVAFVITLWTPIWLCLAVYGALADNHYFGNPPGFND